MKCPNCHCEISSNERICRYCGFDIEASRSGTIMREPEMYYRNALKYYEDNYRKELEKNEHYRQVTLILLIGLVVFLNILEIILVIWR